VDRKAYSKVYNEYKQLYHEAMNDAIERFKHEYPERFTELQAQALRELQSSEPTNGTLTFMFTGRLSIPRSEAQSLVEAAGHKVGSSVSKNTNYLVVGEDPGSKLRKAILLNIPTIDEEGFHSILKGNVPITTKEVPDCTCRHCSYELVDQSDPNLSHQARRFARICGGFTCPICHTQNRF